MEEPKEITELWLPQFKHSTSTVADSLKELGVPNVVQQLELEVFG